jgi:hypothetical protein
MILNAYFTLHSASISYRSRIYKLDERRLGIMLRRYSLMSDLLGENIFITWTTHSPSGYSKNVLGLTLLGPNGSGLVGAFLGC